ncbi:MAG: hypothetical protein AABX84_02430 [Nanoarchaeota archaeon]
MSYFIAAMIHLLFVGLRSFQQINVIQEKYLYIPPTSYLMTGCEVYLVSWIAFQATNNLERLFMTGILGTSAWVGSILSIKIHRMLKKEGKNE